MTATETRCHWSDLPVDQCAHCHGTNLPDGTPVEARRVDVPGRVVWSAGAKPADTAIAGPQHLPDTWAPDAGDGECRCGKPTRDRAYVCDDCTDLFARALGDVPWIDEQTTITITRQRAIPTEGGARTFEKPLPWHDHAAEARRTLHGLLATWCRFCEEEQVRHSSPLDGLPVDTLPAMSAWLLWRLDGLALRDIGPEAVDEITDAVAACHRVIDRRPDRWYAGPCVTEDCTADLYAKRRDGYVDCRDCGATYDVAARRVWLLAEAEDRLAPAVEVARAVSWLGAAPLTADRVRKWAQRERIVAKGHDGHRPLYRIGDAIDLLASDTPCAG